ncbi:MAG: helix-turn-helix transcriptional regulator [Candidatus Binatia bacterium]
MSKVLLRRFGERVRELRRRKKLSQEKLALEAGLDRSYVGGVERGDRNVSLVNIGKISKALGVSLHTLLKL